MSDLTLTPITEARQHGTNARYHIDACRCRLCTDAANEYGRNMRRQQAYGRWQPYVDAQPARDHVTTLRAAGMGPKRIAEVSGVPHGSLAKLLYGDKKRGLAPSKRIRPETEAKLLAVTPDPYPGGVVDGTGTRRRLRALVALGHTQSYLAQRLGRTPTNFYKTVHAGPGIGVCEALRHATVELYDELAMILPAQDTPLERRRVRDSREVARRNRWVPPLALDDERLDDPTYKQNREAVSEGLACRGCGKATTSAKRYCRPCWRERKAS